MVTKDDFVTVGIWLTFDEKGEQREPDIETNRWGSRRLFAPS